MNIGNLRTLVTIERRVVSRNDIGDEIETWTRVAGVYADVHPIRGREYLSLREMQSDITTRITTRYMAGIDTTMRFKVGDAAYEIDSVVDIENKHVALECMCVAATVPT